MRVYRNAVMDNARWTGFEPRPDDIFVCTPSKCGTTWMQTIVASLLWPDGNFPGHIVNGICAVDRSEVHAGRSHARDAEGANAPPRDEEPFAGRRDSVVPAGEVHHRRPRWPRRIHVVVQPRAAHEDDRHAERAGRDRRVAADEEVRRRLPRVLQDLARREQLLRRGRQLSGPCATNRTCCSCTTTT